MSTTIPGTVITFDLEAEEGKVPDEKDPSDQPTVIDMRGVEGEFKWTSGYLQKFVW